MVSMYDKIYSKIYCYPETRVTLSWYMLSSNTHIALSVLIQEKWPCQKQEISTSFLDSDKSD